MTGTLLDSKNPRGILLFAPGAGGDPSRYEHLLMAVNRAGFIVAAPAHELLDGQSATDDQMRERVTELQGSLQRMAREDLPVVAAGHSAGGWAALCLAGARSRNRVGVPLDTPVEPRISRVVLLAPAMAWFSDAEALAGVAVPLTAFVGSADTVTPPQSAERLRTAPAALDLRTYEGVGHFDFMSPMPSGKEPVIDAGYEAFTHQLTEDFIAALG